MKTIFYATGPKFKENFTLDNSSLLYNVDIFGLMCIILNIKKCPPSNGSLENIRPFLKPKRKTIDTIMYFITLVGFSLIVLIGITWSAISFQNVLVKRKEPRSGAYQFSQINSPRIISTAPNVEI
jgi:hypothetical protein